MSRIGKNKRRCDKYKNSGHHEINKHLKQERHEKRMTRFAKRKADGKSYVYQSDRTGTKENPSGPNTFEKGIVTELRDDHRLPYSRWTSIMRKLNNDLAAKEYELKKKRENKRNRYNKKARNEENLPE